jgi:hypothetical protein
MSPVPDTKKANFHRFPAGGMSPAPDTCSSGSAAAPLPDLLPPRQGAC